MAQRKKKTSGPTIQLPSLIITLSEYNGRKKIWNEYYAKVPETRAYKRFVEQKEAMRIGDLGKVKLLAEEARQEILDGRRELTTPPWPDPDVEKRSGRLGVKEWLLNLLDENKQEDVSLIMKINHSFNSGDGLDEARNIFNG